MKVCHTFSFRVEKPNKKKSFDLNQTMRQYRRCVNFYLHEISKGTKKQDIYKKARAIFDLPSALVQTSRDFASEQYKSWKNNPRDKTFPHFDGFTAIRFDKRTISFIESDSCFPLWANIATNNGRVKVPLVGYGKHMETVINRLDEFLAVHLLFKDGVLFLNVIFKDERTIPKEKDFEHFIGVDMGIKNIATVVVQDRQGTVLETQFFPGCYVLEKRRRFRKLRRKLGEKKLWSDLKDSKKREQRFLKDINHRLSRQIVDIASKYDNAVIVLEKLDGIRRKIKYSKDFNWKLHNWSFKQLLEFIVYKAHDMSIAVRRVFPAFTSQVCRNCMSRTVRRSQPCAVCESCKKEYNADWLGANNVVRRLFGYESEGVTGSTFGISKGFVAQLGMS
jgi:IS605 OrfB family transposase